MREKLQRRGLLLVSASTALLLVSIPTVRAHGPDHPAKGSVEAAGSEGAAGAEDEARREGGVTVSAEERAVAVGLLLDSPRSSAVTEEALALAEKLRRHYEIQSGDDFADREAAARRAQEEFLDRLVFGETEIRGKAESLGYSLDPAACANYCANVRELARIELSRDALVALAEGRPGPGRLAETSEEAALQREIPEAGPSPGGED